MKEKERFEYGVPLENANCIFPSANIPIICYGENGDLRYSENGLTIIKKTTIENFINMNVNKTHVRPIHDHGIKFQSLFQRRFQRRRRRTKAEMLLAKNN